MATDSDNIGQIDDNHSPIGTPESEETFFGTEYLKTFTSHLVSIRESESLTDVTLKCQDVKLKCHRVVLAAASPFFHAMFCNEGFEESKQDEVELTTFDSDILRVIINYIYTAEAILNTDNVQRICSACDQLELLDLKDDCDVFMVDKVELTNCFGLYMFAKKYNLEATMEECQERLKYSLKDVLHLDLDSELKILGEDELIECISIDDLVVEDEVTVFKLVEKWVLVDPGNRMKSVDKLMEHVRLARCSPTSLSTEIKESPIMQSSTCAQLVIDALSNQSVAQRQPRQNSENMVLVESENNRGKCWYLDTETEQWCEFAKRPDSTTYFKACVSRHDIIITGGSGATGNYARAFCLSIKKWRMLPQMLHGRRLHGMGCIDDDVYVMGGYTGNRCTDQVEVLHARRGRGWTQIASMRKKLYYHIVVNLENALYVLGGLDQSNNSNMMTQVYDATTGLWETKADMPQVCNRGAAVVLNEKIYVVGDFTRCCLSYDPLQDTWTTHTRPLLARDDPAAVVWKGKIVLCGGLGRNDGEEYDPENNQWTPWQVTLPGPMSYHSMMVVNTSFK